MFLSGDIQVGGGLLVYELGAFSRAFAVMRAAASSIRFDVLDLVIGLPGPPGFKGSGGGALSGSELSHLRSVSMMLTVLFDATKALTWARSFCQTPKMNVDASPLVTLHGPSRVLANKSTWSMPCGESREECCQMR
jgi:hypothetical protein